MKVEELGSLRLNIVYTEDHVFPSEHYTPLRDLLLHSANVGVSGLRTLILSSHPPFLPSSLPPILHPSHRFQTLARRLNLTLNLIFTSFFFFYVCQAGTQDRTRS